jgi:hypothetical protein
MESKKEYKVKDKDIVKMISFSKEKIKEDLKQKEDGKR